MKEYKYVKEWTKKKEKIKYYLILIFISMIIIFTFLGVVKNSISNVITYICTFILIGLVICLFVLSVYVRTCPKCGYYFGRYGYAPKNCPRCGIRIEE